MEDNNLKGIGGWLILVAIGLIISPFRIAFELYITYWPIFTDGTWENVTTVGSDYYQAGLGAILVMECVANAAFALAWVWAAYLFFSTHYWFPRVYITLSLGSLAFILLDAVVVGTVLEGVEMFDQATVAELTRQSIASAIWVSYMLVSKRVKLTFVDGRPEVEPPQSNFQPQTAMADGVDQRYASPQAPVSSPGNNT